MNGEVQVTFKCEGCGRVLCVSKHNPPSSEKIRDNLNSTLLASDVICPVCNPPEPTYGPLTVEMLAEALYVADGVQHPTPPHDSIMDAYGAEARFVRRLLWELDPAPGFFPFFPREWLLGIARKS